MPQKSAFSVLLGAPGSECPKRVLSECFLALLRAQRITQKAFFWGTQSQVPKSTQKALCGGAGHFPAPAPALLYMAARIANFGQFFWPDFARTLVQIFVLYVRVGVPAFFALSHASHDNMSASQLQTLLDGISGSENAVVHHCSHCPTKCCFGWLVLRCIGTKQLLLRGTASLLLRAGLAYHPNRSVLIID